MSLPENGKRKIGWLNLAPTVVAAILISLAIGGYAFYRKVDNSLVTVSDLQKKQIEQAEADFAYKKEMNETMLKFTIAIERLIVQNENQDEMIKDLKESLKDKSFKKSID